MDPRFDPSIHREYDAKSSLITSHTSPLPSPSQQSFNKPQRTQASYGKQKYYQPTITRLPSLLSLLAITLGLIALLQYALLKLPHYDSDGLLSSIANNTVNEAKDILSARDHRLIPRYYTTPATPSAVNPSNYLPIEDGPGPSTSTAPASNYLPIENTNPPVTSAAPASNYLSIESDNGPKTPHYAKPSDYLSVASASSPIPAATAIASAYLPINTSPTVYATAAPTAYLPLNNDPKVKAQGSTDGTQAPSAAPSNYLPLAGGHDPTSTILPTYSITSSNYLPVENGPSTTVGDPALSNYMPVDPGIDFTATHSNYQSLDKKPPAAFTTTGEMDGLNYVVITSAVVIDGHTFATAVPTTVQLGNGKTLVIDNAGNALLGNGSIPVTPQQANHTLTLQQYLIGGIIPTIVAVLFTIPWLILDAAIKEIEPYYQLKRRNGASAGDSLSMNYSSTITAIAAFTSAFKGHYTVLWSSLISLAVLLLAPLSSEAVYIGFIGRCTATSGRHACVPRVSVYPLAARLVQGILTFVAVLTLFLAIAIARRKSGVFASPLCIAGTASLMQNSKLLKMLRGLDPDTPNSKSIFGQLAGCRFRLGPYVDEQGQRSYGIKPSTSYDETSEGSRTFGGEKYASVQVMSVGENDPTQFKRTNWKSYFGRVPLSALAFVVAGMLVLIVYYNRTGGDTSFERFMDSQSFGSRFLFTGIGVGIKLYWSSLDAESQRLEPYRSLVHSPSTPSTLLHLTHSSPFTGLYYSLRHAHFSTATISLLAILCDPLTVALSNIPFAPGIPFITYRASTYISIGVLSLMLLAIAWMLFRAPMPRLVRQPDTLGSVMLFLCGSTMLERFEGMAEMGNRDREKTVKSWGGRYGFGRVVGADGVPRWGIDEVRDREGMSF